MPDLSLRKSYMVRILGKYISLLQFTKCIMLKSLLKYVSKGIEIVLRHYVFYKTLNFTHNCPGTFHPRNVISDL